MQNSASEFLKPRWDRRAAGCRLREARHHGAVRACALRPYPGQRAAPHPAVVHAWFCADREVSIAGVLHEYSALDGVREDVVDILLNLKGVVLKPPWSRQCAAHPSKEGEGPVPGRRYRAAARRWKW